MALEKKISHKSHLKKETHLCRRKLYRKKKYIKEKAKSGFLKKQKRERKENHEIRIILYYFQSKLSQKRSLKIKETERSEKK